MDKGLGQIDMTRKTDPTAVMHALEQEILEENKELYNDVDHRLAFQTFGKLYLGTVKREDGKVHYWWIPKDEEMFTIEERSGGAIVSGNLESPLKRIPQKQMSVSELELVGDIEIPQVLMRALDGLSEAGADVFVPLEYRACDVLLPLLGIQIVPEDDAEYVDYVVENWGFVRFFRSTKRIA